MTIDLRRAVVYRSASERHSRDHVEGRIRAGVPVTCVPIVAGPEEAQDWTTEADWMPCWVSRQAGQDDGAALIATLADLPFPEGEGFVWIAAEASAARTARGYVLERGHPAEWVKASSYWQRGKADRHVRIAG